MSAGDSLPVLSMDAAFEAPADVVPPQQVEWRGVDWHQVLAFALMWEVVYQAGKYACSRSYSKWPKVASLGGSYVTAFLNACVCSVFGLLTVITLLSEDEVARVLVQPDGPWASANVYMAAYSFLAPRPCP